MKTLEEAARIRFKEEVAIVLFKEVKENKDLQKIVDMWFFFSSDT